MTRLRVVGRRTPRGSTLPGAAQTALDVLPAGGQQLSATQVQAFLNASGYVQHGPESLRRVIASDGICRDAVDPEEWFPLQDEARCPADHPLRAEVRELAATMCWGCPVRGACLALALSAADGNAGIWGGLGSQDRAELRPMWDTLRARLGADDAAHDEQRAERTAGAA